MKSTLIGLTFVALSMNSFSQSFPFPSDSAEWYTRVVSSCFIGGSTLDHYWLDFIEGDTIFGSMTYHKIFREERCKHCSAGLHNEESYQFFEQEPVLRGVIREDSGRVFYIAYKSGDIENYPLNIEFLLYDFNLMVGDTFIVTSTLSNPFLFEVRSTYMENMRKVFQMRRINGIGYDRHFIEGQGERDGLFGMYYSPAQSYNLPTPVCFVLNGVPIEGYASCDYCALVGTNSPAHNLEFRIHPNPSTGILSIQIDESKGPYFLKIYDISGSLIYFKKNFIPNSLIDLTFRQLTGCFHVQLTDQNGASGYKSIFIH